MALFQFPYRIQHRRGTYTELYGRNETLLAGEVCYETHDANGLEQNPPRAKVGDGSTPWNDLNYEADIAATIDAATSKTTPVDADELGLVDSAASNILKKLTWANLKATLKTYFDTLYNSYTDENAQDAINALLSAGIHTNISFSYNDAGNALSATVTGGGAGSMSLLDAVAVTGSAVTVLTSGAVSLSSYKEFLVLVVLKNNTASAANISLYFNGDTTAANYARQSATFSGAGSSPTRGTDAIMDSLPASENLTGRITIDNDVDGRPRAIYLGNRDNAANIACRLHAQRWSSASNITSITLSSSVANALAVGSKMYTFGIN